ncbi:unnamed protein product [Microthlaspi erraticum]|uniref:Arabidopsis retrotransposon Orf1 C-terminal domain-containing protein n=1 Tax=Microthlaspi erraticum TaxID=1685480 RepID=A0A6D2HU12_9BRAS|nr:unnamed protein product [Microthlaspi erraticum]
MHLAKFFSHRMESYKELTCEFLASMRYTTHLSRTSDGKRIGEIATQETDAFLDHLLTYKTQPTTLDINKEELSVGGLITPILCAAGVNPTDKKATEPGWMDIKFCKTNLLIEHKELDGRPPVYTLVGHEDDCEKRSLSSIELRIELSQAEDRARNEDLGEPECYYFEEYEAPRMNPSVVAAHKRIGLLQKFNKWQGKAMKDAKVHGQDGEQDQEFGEEGFWFFIKKKKAHGSPHSLGVDHSSPLQGGSLPKSLTEPLLSSQGKERQHAEKEEELPRPDAPTRPPDSIESKQRKLNSIELRVELTWRSPSLRTRIRVRSTPYQDFSQTGTPTVRAASSTKAKGATPLR